MKKITSKDWSVDLIETSKWYSIYVYWKAESYLINKWKIEKFLSKVNWDELEEAFFKMKENKNEILQIINSYIYEDDFLEWLFIEDDEVIISYEEENKNIFDLIDTERPDSVNRISIWNIEDKEISFEKFFNSKKHHFIEWESEAHRNSRETKIKYVYKHNYVFKNELKLYFEYIIEEFLKKLSNNSSDYIDSIHKIEMYEDLWIRNLFDNLYSIHDWCEFWISRNYTYSFSKLKKSFWLDKNWIRISDRKDFWEQIKRIDKLLFEHNYYTWNLETVYSWTFFVNAYNYVHGELKQKFQDS